MPVPCSALVQRQDFFPEHALYLRRKESNALLDIWGFRGIRGYCLATKTGCNESVRRGAAMHLLPCCHACLYNMQLDENCTTPKAKIFREANAWSVSHLPLCSWFQRLSGTRTVYVSCRWICASANRGQSVGQFRTNRHKEILLHRAGTRLWRIHPLKTLKNSAHRHSWCDSGCGDVGVTSY